MRNHAFFDNLAGRHLAETLNRCNEGREGAGSFRAGNIRNAAGADAEIAGTVSGTESTLFRLFPLISAYFQVTRIKKFGDFGETSAKPVRHGQESHRVAKPSEKKIVLRVISQSESET